MDDHKRLDELRRRVEKDPASIAFASLAEELRRTGEHDEAVRVCRAGLEHHPTYLSARVTLGRALLELHQYPDARTELEYVLHAAPDNLLALKAMNELQECAGDTPAADAAPEPAKAGPHVQAASAETLPVAEPPARPSLSMSPRNPDPQPGPEPVAQAPPEPGAHVSAETARDPALGELEAWQSRIQADRAQRAR